MRCSFNEVLGQSQSAVKGQCLFHQRKSLVAFFVLHLMQKRFLNLTEIRFVQIPSAAASLSLVYVPLHLHLLWYVRQSLNASATSSATWLCEISE